MTRNDHKQIHIPEGPGTYVLLLYLLEKRIIEVGKLGRVRFTAGWYAYVGSAMGPGGVASRVKRHLKANKSKHWHIDYLRPVTRITGIWVGQGRKVREHLWASRLGQTPLMGEPVDGFGCSDCSCAAHLYFFPQEPDPLVMASQLKAQLIREVDNH